MSSVNFKGVLLLIGPEILYNNFLETIQRILADSLNDLKMQLFIFIIAFVVWYFTKKNIITFFH